MDESMKFIDNDDFLNINLCGKPYELSRKCLEKHKEFAETFLAEFAQMSHKERLLLSDDFSAQNDSYFFWKSPDIFDCILT